MRRFDTRQEVTEKDHVLISCRKVILNILLYSEKDMPEHWRKYAFQVANEVLDVLDYEAKLIAQSEE